MQSNRSCKVNFPTRVTFTHTHTRFVGRPPSEQLRAFSDILSDSLSGRPHQSQRTSFTALWYRPCSSCSCGFDCRLFTSHMPRAVCLSCEKTSMFLWAKIRPDFTEHFTCRFCIKTETLRENVLNSACWTISVCELLQIVNFNGLWTLIVWYFWQL